MLLVVSRYRPSDRVKAKLEAFMPAGMNPTYYGIDPHRRVGEDATSISKATLKELRGDFDEFMDQWDMTGSDYPDVIMPLGNEALYVTTGHSGIMKWRGKDLSYRLAGRDIPLLATIAPGAVERNPSQAELLRADMKAAHRVITGDTPDDGVLPDKIHAVTTKSKLAELCQALREADAVAFDLETSSFDELAPGAFIVSIALTTNHNHELTCWTVPLCHRASVWSSRWQKVLQIIAREMCDVPVRIAHNAKFDCRWMAQFDAPVPVNWDTMLAAHLLDENRPKGLKHLSRVLLDAPEWDIQIKGGKTAKPWYHQHPLKEILKYNALDTWHTMRLHELFAPDLYADPRLRTLFEKLVMPASQSLVHIERRGVYVDPDKLNDSAKEVFDTLNRLHQELETYLPPDDQLPYPVNWNPSNFLRWFLFTYLQMPVIREGKTGPSTAEDVMTHLAAQDFPVAKLLVERVKWQKFSSSFIAPYQELITDESRLHTTFKLAGTRTGRLSSGKADADKVTGSAPIRGVNLQQVPRDKLVRGLFGAPPGWTFVEADYSQIELRIAAEIAKESTMLGLYSRGEDIHMTMAMRMTGKPASAVSSEERKKAKAVNFGFLYGMGWRKFIETAWNNYGLTVTEHEAQSFRQAFFAQFPELMIWHARQRRLAHKYQRVQSPLGRIRHLPDITSDEPGVVAEAERQAINSPVQATASDLCLLSLVILDRKFRKEGLSARPIGTVHDAINFEIPDEELPVALPMIKRVMENPPTQQLFGYSFKVPIISDVAVGTHWGTKTEIPSDTVSSPTRLKEWLESKNLPTLHYPVRTSNPAEDIGQSVMYFTNQIPRIGDSVTIENRTYQVKEVEWLFSGNGTSGPDGVDVHCE